MFDEICRKINLKYVYKPTSVDANYTFVLCGIFLSQNGSVVSIQQVFSSNFKRIRKSRKLSQEQLAELLECSPRYVQRIESGKAWPRIPFIKNLSKCLKVKETDLFKV